MSVKMEVVVSSDPITTTTTTTTTTTCVSKSVQTPSSIFELNLLCYYEIFDCLPLKDLIAIAKTCKHLQRIAGDYFRMNYSAKSGRVENDGIYISSLQSNIFSEYIKKLSISGDRLQAYHFVGKNCTNSLKHFRAYGILPNDGFKLAKNVLNGIEMLEMNECVIKGEFYQNHLQFCQNLKSLSVSRSGYIQDKSILIGTGNEWMLRTYPTLINFELTDAFELKMNELNTFFEQNPNIQTFSTDARSLWENRQTIINCKANIDILAINICQSKIIDSNKQPVSIKDSVYNILVELYNRRFYKRLHLYVYFVDQVNLDKLFQLSAIELLNGDVVQVHSLMNDLKTLSICYGDEILNMNSLPPKCLQLERLYFSEISTDRILPFIRFSAKLKIIKIRTLKDGDRFKSINWSALNEERKRLKGARRLIVFVKEEVYLATKWDSEAISFSMIELIRFEAAEWVELSARARYFKSF